MSRKKCELCNKPARMFCESDQASLCIHCDEKVHAANFLVAKHSRTLLCHACGSPTAWSAQGPILGLTVSVCRACSDGRRGGNANDGSHDDSFIGGDLTAASTSCNSQEGVEDNNELLYSEESDDEYDDDDDDESFYDSEDGKGENQVVPWSEGEATWRTDLAINDSSYLPAKRACDYDDAAFESEDEDGCCSSQHTTETKSCDISSSFQESDDDSSALRPSKIRRRNGEVTLASSPGRPAIVEKLQSFQQEITKPLP